jgi:hypothetical protein
LATPILVTLKVLAEHSERGKPMLEFLNRNAVKRPTNERVMREAL